jgi:hypothetical protein
MQAVYFSQTWNHFYADSSIAVLNDQTKLIFYNSVDADWIDSDLDITGIAQASVASIV